MSRPENLRVKEFSRILLIKPSALGDVIHTLPVLVKLRRRYPAAEIDWLVTPENAEVVRCHPAVTRVVLFDRRGFAKRKFGAAGRFLALLSQIRSARYDLVVDLHGQLRSAVFAFASGAPVRVGFDRPVRRSRTQSSEYRLHNVPHRGWTGAREGAWLAYTHRIPIPTLDVHAIDRYLWVGSLLGFDNAWPESTVHIPSEAEKRIDELLTPFQSGAKPLAVLVPGTMWETKHWPPDRFAAVASHLVRGGFSVALAGSPADRSRCAQILARCPTALDLSGQTSTGELAALIRRAAVCVTNDSGSMHLGVALGCPVVSVFGPTNPVHIGPYRHPESVVRAETPCSPCNYRRLSQCEHGHACMQDVRPSDVIRRVESILSRRRSKSPMSVLQVNAE